MSHLARAREHGPRHVLLFYRPRNCFARLIYAHRIAGWFVIWVSVIEPATWLHFPFRLQSGHSLSMSLCQRVIQEREVLMLTLEATNLTRSFAWQGVPFKIKMHWGFWTGMELDMRHSTVCIANCIIYLSAGFLIWISYKVRHLHQKLNLYSALYNIWHSAFKKTFNVALVCLVVDLLGVCMTLS
jgi:hypothetical protein